MKGMKGGEKIVIEKQKEKKVCNKEWKRKRIVYIRNVIERGRDNVRTYVKRG